MITAAWPGPGVRITGALRHTGHAVNGPLTTSDGQGPFFCAVGARQPWGAGLTGPAGPAGQRG